MGLDAESTDMNQDQISLCLQFRMTVILLSTHNMPCRNDTATLQTNRWVRPPKRTFTPINIKVNQQGVEKVWFPYRSLQPIGYIPQEPDSSHELGLCWPSGGQCQPAVLQQQRSTSQRPSIHPQHNSRVPSTLYCSLALTMGLHPLLHYCAAQTMGWHPLEVKTRERDWKRSRHRLQHSSVAASELTAPAAPKVCG